MKHFKPLCAPKQHVIQGALVTCVTSRIRSTSARAHKKKRTNKALRTGYNKETKRKNAKRKT